MPSKLGSNAMQKTLENITVSRHRKKCAQQISVQGQSIEIHSINNERKNIRFSFCLNKTSTQVICPFYHGPHGAPAH